MAELPPDELARGLARKYELTYRAQVNLEGAITSLHLDGVPLSRIQSFLEDVLDNIEFALPMDDWEHPTDHGGFW